MRYFHRTSVAPDDVLAEADAYFGERLECSDAGDRHRSFGGTIGRIDLKVEAEGGHYTLITVVTDQVGESEADKVAKRFLGLVHKRAEPEHEVKGAY
jgi:hypothetical protein